MEEILTCVHTMINDRVNSGTLSGKEVRDYILIALSGRKTLKINDKDINISDYHIFYQLGFLEMIIVEDEVTPNQMFKIREIYKEYYLIIILKDANSNAILRCLKREDLSSVFSRSEILSCPTKSYLLPNMTMLKGEELSLDKDKLPVLLFDDISRRWYGFPKDSIIKIKSVYNDERSFTQVQYRKVKYF